MRELTNLSLPLSLLRMLIQQRPRFVFLKQYHHLKRGERGNPGGFACYKAIVEADFKFDVRKIDVYPEHFDMLLNQYWSHALADELGLSSGVTGVGFEDNVRTINGFNLEMDFEFGNGHVVYKAPAD